MDCPSLPSNGSNLHLHLLPLSVFIISYYVQFFRYLTQIEGRRYHTNLISDSVHYLG